MLVLVVVLVLLAPPPWLLTSVTPEARARRRSMVVEERGGALLLLLEREEESEKKSARKEKKRRKKTETLGERRSGVSLVVSLGFHNAIFFLPSPSFSPVQAPRTRTRVILSPRRGRILSSASARGGDRLPKLVARRVKRLEVSVI